MEPQALSAQDLDCHLPTHRGSASHLACSQNALSASYNAGPSSNIQAFISIQGFRIKASQSLQSSHVCTVLFFFSFFLLLFLHNDTLAAADSSEVCRRRSKTICELTMLPPRENAEPGSFYHKSKSYPLQKSRPTVSAATTHLQIQLARVR